MPHGVEPIALQPAAFSKTVLYPLGERQSYKPRLEGYYIESQPLPPENDRYFALPDREWDLR